MSGERHGAAHATAAETGPAAPASAAQADSPAPPVSLTSLLGGTNIGRLPGALPLIPGWTDHRDLPKPGTSFRSWWDQREKDRARGGSAPATDSTPQDDRSGLEEQS